MRYGGPRPPLFRSIRAAVAARRSGADAVQPEYARAHTREDSCRQERLLAATRHLRRRVRAAAGVHRPLRPDEVCRHRADAGDRPAHGARRDALVGPRRWCAKRRRDGPGGRRLGLGSALWLVGYAREQLVDLQPIDRCLCNRGRRSAGRRRSRRLLPRAARHPYRSAHGPEARIPVPTETACDRSGADLAASAIPSIATARDERDARRRDCVSPRARRPSCARSRDGHARRAGTARDTTSATSRR